MNDFSQLPTADQGAIGKTLLTLLKAFDERDAEPLLQAYSDDADWVNAFGTVKRGRDDIVEYLRGLLRDQNFNRGAPGRCAVLFDPCRMTLFYLSRIWGSGWRRAAAEPPHR